MTREFRTTVAERLDAAARSTEPARLRAELAEVNAVIAAMLAPRR